MLRPGVRENEVVAAAMKVLFELGSEHVEAINAISGDRCNPHPHTFADRLLRPGDQAFFDIIHSFMGYRTCYYRTFNVELCDAGADRRLQAVPRVARQRDRPRPARRDDGQDRRGLADRQGDRHGGRACRFGLQFGHGLGVGLYESPMISRLHSFEAPVELEVGMVFALETYCPATDGRSAARIEEEVVVTPTGPRVLTRFPADELLVTGTTYVRGLTAVVIAPPRHRVARRRSSGNGAGPSPPRLAGSTSPATSSQTRCRFEGQGRSAHERRRRVRRRSLPADAADPPLRGSRPEALPPRRGLRNDPSLLGAGGGCGRLCERAHPGDRVACTYRGHGHLLAAGTEPEALLAELLGRSTGVNGGRAGSMNIVDPDHGLIGCFGIVGGSIAAATGAALALRGTGSRRGGVLRGRRHQPGVLLRVPQLRQGARAAGRVRLREQRLRRVHADGGGDRRRRSRRAPPRWDLPTTEVDGMDVWAVARRRAT